MRFTPETTNQVIKLGQPWSITCVEMNAQDVNWTKDGTLVNIALSAEMAKGLIHIDPKKPNSTTLIASAAAENHQGRYKCTADINAYILEIDTST